MIIHKTGTMLATGQGPGATPSGPGSVYHGDGVRGPGSLRVRNRAGGDGEEEQTRGSNSNTCQEGARRGRPEMKRNRHRSWDGAGVERSCGDGQGGIGMTPIPQELPPASILPSLPPLSDTNPPVGPLASLSAPTAPAPAQLQLNSLSPKGIQVLWELCSCSKHRGLFPSLPSPHTKCAQGASQLPSLPRRVWSSHKVPPFPLPGMQPEPRLLQTRREGRERCPPGAE